MTDAQAATENSPDAEPAPAARRPASAWRHALVTALLSGVFAGLAEVSWAYLLPSISVQWRAELPVRIADLLTFVAAAVTADAVLAVLATTILLFLLMLLTRTHSLFRRIASWTPALVIWGTLSYLYVGWMVLFILLSNDRGRLSYKVLIFGGVGLLLLVTLLSRAAGRMLCRKAARRGALVANATPLAAILLVLAVVFARYSASHASTPVVRPKTATLEFKPDVLLVTLDTLRADYLGCYGHPWIQTPIVDALARDGVVFDSAISQAPSTCPSHCSILTSSYPFDHGAENGKPMRDGLITLADVFAAHGYDTAAFVSSTTTRSISSGLQQGFAIYQDSLVPWSTAFGRDEFQNLILFYVIGIAQKSQIAGDVVSERALAWLSRPRARPFFTWLHYFDPHSPYGSPPPYHDMYAGRITDGLPMAAQRERYAEDITYADAQLGRVIESLKSSGRYDETLIIVMSDHGEAFGEMHGGVKEVAHGRYLYDTTQHVPLIIKPPAALGVAPRRIATQVELVDMAPTALAALGMPIPEGWTGTSLETLLASGDASAAHREAHAFNIIDVPAANAPARTDFVQQIAVRTPQWKFISIPRIAQEELYDLITDPREAQNVLSAHGGALSPFREIVRRFWDPARATNNDPRQRLAPALLQQLEALGYLGGQPEPEEDEPADAESDEDSPQAAKP